MRKYLKARGSTSLLPLVVIGTVAAISIISAIISVTQLAQVRQTTSSEAAATCSGCISKTGMCLTGNANTACGQNGSRCSNCISSGAVCKNNRCVRPNQSPAPQSPAPKSPTPTAKAGPAPCRARGDHWGVYGDSCSTDGWAKGGTGEQVDVNLYVDDKLKGTFPANSLGGLDNNSRFYIDLRPYISDTNPHSIRIKTYTTCEEEWTLSNSPQTITCSSPIRPPTPGY